MLDIRRLTADWYTSRPIPERLILALADSPLVTGGELPKHRHPRLTDKDRYALAVAARGHSTESVKQRLRHARWALDARNTTHAVAIAIRQGLLL